jgi:hypothetical protein
MHADVVQRDQVWRTHRAASAQPGRHAPKRVRCGLASEHFDRDDIGPAGPARLATGQEQPTVPARTDRPEELVVGDA